MPHVSLSNLINQLGDTQTSRIIYQIQFLTGLDTIDLIPDDKVYLNNCDFKKYSQFGEDGLTLKIFELIGTTNKVCLDIGFTPQGLNNTDILVNDMGFTRIGIGAPDYFVNVENLGGFLRELKVPQDLDYVSIDIDGNDWYILRELVKWTRPRAIVIEYNAEFDVDDDRVIPYDSKFMWDHKTDYFGASLKALTILARTIGYSLVGCNKHGNDCFMIRDDLVPPCLHGVNDYKLLYRSLHSTGSLTEYYEPDIVREWVKAQDLITEQNASRVPE